MTEPGGTQPATWGGSITVLRIAIGVSLVFLLLGFVSVVWTPYPVANLDVGSAMQDPSGAHWLGTDQLGRDVVSLIMKGILTSFVVAAVAVAIGALIGVPLGLGAALLGSYVDFVVSGIGAYLMAVPAFIVAVLLAALFGPSAATLMVGIGIANVVPLALATRHATVQTQGHDYVAAARLAGASGLDLARHHTLPVIVRWLIAQAVAQMAFGIIAEAALSYIGLGVQPPATSLGVLLHDAQSFGLAKPLLLIVPGLVIVLIVLALNLTSWQLRWTVAADLRSEDDRGTA
jgi:peptide/nickel transport system permease protein